MVGGDCEAIALAVALYNRIVTKVVSIINFTAEAVKLTENIFRSVNIALVNELIVYEKMGVDVWEVIDQQNPSLLVSYTILSWAGLGGHCIPIDPFYLTWKARIWYNNSFY